MNKSNHFLRLQDNAKAPRDKFFFRKLLKPILKNKLETHTQ